MARIFITYGDERFTASLQRIEQEAKALNMFDEIIIYTPKDLPPYIQASPLMAFTRGGGYWVWKPYVIYHTLQTHKDGDIVVYADAGCSLQPSSEWSRYWDLMKTTDTLLFHYRSDVEYVGWREGFNCTDTAIGRWTKRETREYFDNVYGSTDWQCQNKIFFLGGQLFVNQLIINVLRTG